MRIHLAKTRNTIGVPEWDAGGIPACSRWLSASDTTGFVPPLKAPRQGCKQLFLRKKTAPQKKFRTTFIEQTTLLASLRDAQFGGSLPVVSLPLHTPATGWDASGILQQPAATTCPLRRPARSMDLPATTTCPLHSIDPSMRWFFALGLGDGILCKTQPCLVPARKSRRRAPRFARGNSAPGRGRVPCHSLSAHHAAA